MKILPNEGGAIGFQSVPDGPFAGGNEEASVNEKDVPDVIGSTVREAAELWNGSIGIDDPRGVNVLFRSGLE
jgi:hypothetical protein